MTTPPNLTVMSSLQPKHSLCILHLEDSIPDRELVQELFRA